MSSPCPARAPDYYLTITHTIAAISAPINLLSLYLIAFRSTGTYKYYVFYLQAVTVLTELQMTLVCPGYYFFPLLGGYNLNSFFGSLMKTHIYMSIYTFLLSSELPAIFFCFVYRHNAAVDMGSDGTKKRPVKMALMIGSQLFPFATGASMYLSEISREETYNFLKQNYPQCLGWLQNELFVVYDYHINPWVAVTGVGALVCVGIFGWTGFGLGFHTMIVLHRLRPHMSVQTYRIHRAALLSLSLQVVIPGVLLVIPLNICFVVVFLGLVEHQEFATNSTVMISCHSMCSSVVMIATNSKHREFLWSKICGKGLSGVRAHVEPSSSMRTVVV